MKRTKLILAPSYSRDPAFTTGKNASATYSWTCPVCGEEVSIPYEKIIQQYGGKHSSPYIEKEEKTLFKIFDIGYVGKSPDGGWPVFSLATCPSCKTKFSVYSGVREPSNSLFVITMQGIAQIRENGPTNRSSRPEGLMLLSSIFG
jgi:hypothetical protein